jgi:hypothetical protein
MDITALLARMYDETRTTGAEALALRSQIIATGFDLQTYSSVMARGGWDSLPLREQGQLLRESPAVALELRRAASRAAHARSLEGPSAA